MDLEATKHMTLHRMVFNTYEVICPHNVSLGDDSMAKDTRMGSIVVGVEMKGKINRICITYVLHVPKLHKPTCSR